MATTVTVTRSPNDPNIGVRVDDTVLAFTAQGQATTDVAPGTHFLNFFMVMPPGTNVTLAVTTPPAAKWSLTQAVPADGVFAGFHRFTA